MSVVMAKAAELPVERGELVPRYFDTSLIVTPEENPSYSPEMLADLLTSIKAHGQLVPGFVCPSPELAKDMRICIEGNRRLATDRILGVPFWAFDLERFVPEEERIMLSFQHNHSRRVMSREEIAERAARYMEIKGCTAGEAAQHLNISQAMLSRAFGDQRIPPELRPRTDVLGGSIRSLVAAVPLQLMPQAVEYAETSGPDGKIPTRDQVSAFIQRLKKNGKPAGSKPKTIPLRMNGRLVTLTVRGGDTPLGVLKDLNAIVAKLGKHPDVQIEGWPFLCQ
jgi:ParB/RepB/Spo0J family partition protein